MKPETLSPRAAKLERRQSLAHLRDAAEGLPSHQKAALMSRIMKEVVAGRISAAEANRITKAMKV